MLRSRYLISKIYILCKLDLFHTLITSTITKDFCVIAAIIEAWSLRVHIHSVARPPIHELRRDGHPLQICGFRSVKTFESWSHGHGGETDY